MFNNLINKARNHNMRYKTKRFQCYFGALFHVQTFMAADSSSIRNPLRFHTAGPLPPIKGATR